MNHSLTLTVQLFGRFREYGNACTITVPYRSTVQAAKAALQAQLGSEHSVEQAVLATDDAILHNDELLDDLNYSLLPPVCGG